MSAIFTARVDHRSQASWVRDDFKRLEEFFSIFNRMKGNECSIKIGFSKFLSKNRKFVRVTFRDTNSKEEVSMVGLLCAYFLPTEVDKVNDWFEKRGVFVEDKSHNSGSCPIEFSFSF